MIVKAGARTRGQWWWTSVWVCRDQSLSGLVIEKGEGEAESSRWAVAASLSVNRPRIWKEKMEGAARMEWRMTC